MQVTIPERCGECSGCKLLAVAVEGLAVIDKLCKPTVDDLMARSREYPQDRRLKEKAYLAREEWERQRDIVVKVYAPFTACDRIAIVVMT